MNDIEKQIEGVNDEEGVDMNRLNSNNNDKKKIIGSKIYLKIKGKEKIINCIRTSKIKNSISKKYGS